MKNIHLLFVLLIFLIIAKLSFAECKNYQIVDSGDKIEAVCSDELPLEAKKSSQEVTSKSETSTLQDFNSSEFLTNDSWVAIDLGKFEPRAINNSTQIAGDVISPNGSRSAGVWKHGFIEKLDGIAKVKSSSAVAINNSGRVVGYQFEEKLEAEGYNKDGYTVLWENGVTGPGQKLADGKSKIIGINNNGEVILENTQQYLISSGKFLEARFVEIINYCCDTSQLAAGWFIVERWQSGIDGKFYESDC